MTKYLIIKGTSGIGNRVLAAATGLLYGRISGRQVIMDWRDGSYSNDGTNLFFKYFDSPSAQLTSELPITDSVYPGLWKDKLNRSLGGVRHEYNLQIQEMSFDVSRLDYPEDVIVFCAYTHKIQPMRSLFIGEFSNFSKMSNKEILNTVITQEIHLKPDIQDRVEEFKARYFSGHTIGVHIRYSDMKVPLEKMETCLRGILNNIQQKTSDFTVFISTDSQLILSQFKDKFPNIISTEKWFSPSGKRLHQNPQECPNLLQNGIEALTDLYLLASCDTLLFASRSSFGFLASVLISNPNAKLYDIDQPTWWQKLRTKILSQRKRYELRCG